MCTVPRAETLTASKPDVKRLRGRLREQFSRPGLTPVDRCVWLLISAYANKDREAWPSIELLGEKLELHPKTVEKSLGVLRRAGIIQRFRADSGQLRWFVVLDLTRWSTLDGATPAAPAITPPVKRYPRAEESMDSSGVDPLLGSGSAPAEESMDSSHNMDPRSESKEGEGEPPPTASRSISAEQEAASALVRDVYAVIGCPASPNRNDVAGAAVLLAQSSHADVVATVRAAIAKDPTRMLDKAVKLFEYPSNLRQLWACANRDKRPTSSPATARSSSQDLEAESKRSDQDKADHARAAAIAAELGIGTMQLWILAGKIKRAKDLDNAAALEHARNQVLDQREESASAHLPAFLRAKVAA